jgi:hypothetical protein
MPAPPSGEGVQLGVALGTLHMLLQAPQLFGSLPMFVSQPFVASPSQFAKPGMHAPSAQLPLRHSALAFGYVAHGVQNCMLQP